MLDVVISYGNVHTRFLHKRIERIVTTVLKTERIRSAVVGVRFVDNREMAVLNQSYRGKKGSTDVLAFSGDKAGSGDIIIAVPYVRKVIQKEGYLMGDYIGMLLVHGILHTIGYDHMKERDRKKMWNKQNTYCVQLGLVSIPFEDFG